MATTFKFFAKNGQACSFLRNLVIKYKMPEENKIIKQARAFSFGDEPMRIAA